MYRNENSPQPEGKITLVTILAVCAILFVTLAIMAPAVGQYTNAQNAEAARQRSCQKNMKELGLAFTLYYNDYDFTFPSSYLYGRSKAWSKTDFSRFASLRGTLPPRPRDVNLSWPMLLYPFMKNKSIIWCQSDPADRNAKSARVSYYYKAAADCAWYGGPEGKGAKCQRAGDFDFPADQIIFWEHNGWHPDQTSEGATNGVMINVCYLDGHVGLKRIRDSGYTRDENPPGPLPKSGVGEPAWYNWDRIRNEGLGKGAYWYPQACADNLP